jgi:hypothetical protein
VAEDERKIQRALQDSILKRVGQVPVFDFILFPIDKNEQQEGKDVGKAITKTIGKSIGPVGRGGPMGIP